MSDLYHFGVKGMKWGIRKDRQSKDYGEGDRIIKKKAARVDDQVIRN